MKIGQRPLIYNAFRKLLAKYCQALPQEDSSLIYEISSLQYEKSLFKNGRASISLGYIGIHETINALYGGKNGSGDFVRQ